MPEPWQSKALGSVKIEGAEQIIAKLKLIDRKLGGKIVRAALRGGAKIAQTKAKQLAPVKSGFLRGRIKVRAMKRKRGRVGLSVVTGLGDYVGKTFYAAMLEYGHKVGARQTGVVKRKEERTITPAGRASYKRQVIVERTDTRQQRVEGTKHLTRAFAETKDQVQAHIEGELQRGLDEAVRGG